jgi:ATP adenylyltransferase
MRRPDALSRLWAPWRMPYLKKITGPRKPGGCFLCDYARAPGKDPANLVVLRGKDCLTVLNRFPYAGGHLLIAPVAHKADLGGLTAAERTELFDQLVRMQATLDRLMRPQGYNIGVNLGRAAGAGVPGHLHFHLIPRWNGDTNFMTTVADARVLPQALEELHAELQKALRRGR